MSYTPPDADAVDFGVESYSAPAADSVNFDVSGIVTITPDPATLRVDALDATIGPAKIIVRPGPATLQLDTRAVGILTDVLVQPEPATLQPDTPSPATIQRFLLADEWQVDGDAIKPESLTLTARTTTLSFEVDAADIDQWRRFDRAGDISVQAGFGGAFRAIDRGGRASVTELRPANQDSPPVRDTNDYRIQGYQEEQIGPARYRVSLTLQRESNRTVAFSAVSQSGGDWQISLDSGTIALDTARVGYSPGTGTTAGRQIALPLRISDTQAGALLDNLGYPGGVSERAVPDGADDRVDESPDSRQTITLSTPDGAALSDGDYYVTGWRAEINSFETDSRWRVELTLVE